jgi:RNA polymerase sigma-70 factor (ECF subfamily)
LLEDRELWKRISEGNAAAFDAFYRDNGPRLRAFLRHLLPSEQAAEDIMQDTFTQIWRCPQGFNPERGSLRGYLFGIGRKLAAEWWRRQKQTDALNEESAAPCQTEMSSMVADAFNRLSSEQRTLLWLREVEGQSYAELAAILEVPIGTVRSRLFAAREALRNVWHVERVEKGGPHDVR